MSDNKSTSTTTTTASPTAISDAFPGAFTVSASTFALISVVGICLNSSIVYVTARAKLRGTCHFLLALVGVFEVLHQSSHFVYFYIVVLGPGSVPYTLCIWLQAPSTMGLNALQLTLLATAFDRLFSARAPVFYKLNNDDGRRKALYLGVLSVAIFGYGLFSAGYSIWLAGTPPGKQLPPWVTPTTCDIADTFTNFPLYTYFTGNTLVLDVACALLYVFMWLSVRHFQATDLQRRLLKSLITIVVVNVGGYFINLGLLLLGRFFLHWPWTWYQTQIYSIFLNLAAAANAPILYWMSTEYREAFNTHLVNPILELILRCAPRCCSTSVEVNNGGQQPAVVDNIFRRLQLGRNRLQQQQTWSDPAIGNR